MTQLLKVICLLLLSVFFIFRQAESSTIPSIIKSGAAVVLLEPEKAGWTDNLNIRYIKYMENAFSYSKAVYFVETLTTSVLQTEFKSTDPGSDFKSNAEHIGGELKADFVFGGIITQNTEGFLIEMFVYDMRKRKIDYEYTEQVSNITAIPREVAIFSAHAIINSCHTKGPGVIFKSIFIPGLGQYKSGHKLRGIAYFAGTIGLVLKAVTLKKGDPYRPQDTLTSITEGNEYYWGERKILFGEYQEEFFRRQKAETSRDDAGNRIKELAAFACIFHVINLTDAFFISKKFSTKKLREKFTIIALPDPSISISFRF